VQAQFIPLCTRYKLIVLGSKIIELIAELGHLLLHLLLLLLGLLGRIPLLLLKH